MRTECGQVFIGLSFYVQAQLHLGKSEIERTEMGDTDAQFSLASYYHDQVDVEAAFLWYERAAERGHLEAQSQLGSCYLFGTGVDKHLTVAATWFEKAAVRGHAGARYLLACCKKMQEREECDKKPARIGLREAAERWFCEAAKSWGLPESNLESNLSGLELREQLVRVGFPANILNLEHAFVYVKLLTYGEALNRHLQENLRLAVSQAAFKATRTIDLSGWYYGDECARDLFQKLRQTVQVLNLPRNNIRDEGARTLARSIEQGTLSRLHTLDLSNNEIGCEGAKALAKALESGLLPELRVLRLGGNDFGEEGTNAVGASLERGSLAKLHTLDFEPDNSDGRWKRSQRSKTCVLAFSKSLASGSFPKLCRLNLSYIWIRDDGATELATALRRGLFPLLQDLNLRDCAIGPPGIKALALALKQGSFLHLESIDLGLNDITAQEVVELARAFNEGRFLKLKKVRISRQYEDFDGPTSRKVILGKFLETPSRGLYEFMAKLVL